MRRPNHRHIRRTFEKEKQRNALAPPGCHEFIMVCDGLKADFNIGKLFRSAEAFGARAVHLIAIDCFNPYPARGTFRQVPARFFDDFSDSYTALCKMHYAIFAVTPRAETCITDVAIPKKSAFVLGHEEFGHSFKLTDYPAITPLQIPMFGRVESLNVSVAASIVMYEYIRQHAG